MAKHLQFFGWVAVVVFVFGIAGTAKAQTSDLIGMLTSQLGVSEKQAAGGSGSLLSFAKDQMSSADFDVVSSALPDVSGLIKGAPDGGSSLLGSSGSLLGGSSSGLGDIAGVASTFSDLGMSTDMVNQFVPVVLEYAQTAGSERPTFTYGARSACRGSRRPTRCRAIGNSSSRGNWRSRVASDRAARR